MTRLAIASCALVGALLVAPDASAGHVSVFLGTPGGTGSVRVYDEALLSAPVDPPELQGIRLLVLDVAGRTRLEELLPGRTRWRDDVPQASRLALPNGWGSLYRYVRDDGASALVHGLMHVDASGLARSVLELPEPSPGLEPFHERVAVAPAGNAVLVATKASAGGDLLEIDLASGLMIDRTATLPPQHLDGAGLGLRAGWGVGISDGALLRFDRAPTAQAQPVAFAQPAPTWFARQVVFSQNGLFAATIAGDEQASAHAWVFAQSGPAQRASDVPGPLAGVGALPDVQGGPWLAVSDDGSLCAWKLDAGHGYGRELFLGRVPAAGTEPPLHVTQDAFFEPYIDEIGEYLFRPGNVLVFSAGNPKGSAPGALADMDVFQVRWPSGGAPQLANLSLSSGEAFPPFVTYPALQPERVLALPGADGRLVDTAAGAGDELLHVAVDQLGATTLASGALGFEPLGIADEELIFLELHAAASSDHAVRELEVPVEEAPETVSPLVAQQDFVHGALAPDGESLVYVTTDGAAQFAWRLTFEGEELELLTPRPLLYGPALAFTPGGGVALSVGAPGAPATFLVWRPVGAPLRLNPAPAPGFLLPGA